MINNPFVPQSIGDPECPIMYRWTLFPPFLGSQSANKGFGRQPLKVPDWMPKLLLHHFVPRADERHLHDHPRPFITLVLRGGYDDMVPCTNPECKQGKVKCHPGVNIKGFYFCMTCGSTGQILGEAMRPGMLRYRPAHHIHRTQVHSKGCWTIVIMGPLVRKWGFWVDGKWMFWKRYQETYGYGMRCV